MKISKLWLLACSLSLIIIGEVLAVDNIAGALDRGADDIKLIAKSLLAFAIIFAGGRIAFSKTSASDEIGPLFWGGVFIFAGSGVILWLSTTLG